jgi:hypothetical protein
MNRMMITRVKPLIYVSLLLLLLLSAFGCVDEIKVPQRVAEKTIFQPLQQGMGISMPYKAKKPAVIFRIDGMAKGRNEEVISQLLTIFASNNGTLDIGFDGTVADVKDYQIDILKPYISAGLVGFSLNQPDLTQISGAASSEKLRLDLMKKMGAMQAYYGAVPVALTTNTEITELNYQAIRDAGFKIVSTYIGSEKYPSRKPLTYAGKEDSKGMFRFPVVAAAAWWDRERTKIGTVYSKDARADLLKAVDDSLVSIGIAVVKLDPESFLDANRKIDSKKLADVGSALKDLSKECEITTFGSWYQYAAQWILAAPFVRQKSTPEYTGGRVIILRMDDVTKGWHEEVVDAIIKLAIKNGVPLDLGVVASASGTSDSFQIPMVHKYYNEGVVDISVHGYDWTYGQFSTVASGVSFTEMKFNMVKAMEQYRIYYGAYPVAFTPPTDVFDCSGYRAVQEAGLKIFSTHITDEPHPSLDPVDCWGKRTPNGMMRIPTASDVCNWDNDNRTWGVIYPIQKSAGDRPIYGEDYLINEEGGTDYNDLSWSVYYSLDMYSVATISIHPDAFLDASGKIDQTKIAQLDNIFKWAKQTAKIATFRTWYNYATSNKLKYPVIEQTENVEGE